MSPELDTYDASLITSIYKLVNAFSGHYRKFAV